MQVRILSAPVKKLNKIMEDRYIDPFSYPEERTTIEEAANLTGKKYSELGAGKRTGVVKVKHHGKKIYFCTRYQKHSYNLPTQFMGYECIVKVVADRSGGF